MIKIIIQQGNAAFCDPSDDGNDTIYCEPETARILRDLADRIQNGQLSDENPLTLRDYNGNPVGICEMVYRP